MSRRNATPVEIPPDIAEVLEGQDKQGKHASENGELHPGKRLRVTWLHEAETKPVETRWGGRIIKNMVNNLQGPGGIGKSSIANYIAARWTTGDRLEGESGTFEPGRVLIFSAEDDISRTIKPRIEVLGGDPRMVAVSDAIFHVDESGHETVVSVTLQDISTIRAWVQEVRPTLMILDPITSFTGRIDMNKANEVRPLLEALKQLAEEYGVTIINIVHVGKTQLSPGQAAYRALGSVDFVNVARSVLVTAEYDGQKFLAHAKHNLTRPTETLGYSITDSDVLLGDHYVPTLLWHGASDVSTDDLFAPAGHRGRESAFSDKEVEAEILSALTVEMSAKDLETLLRDDLGVSKHQFETARAKLKRAGKIRTRRQGFGGGVVWHRTDRPVYQGEEGDSQ